MAPYFSVFVYMIYVTHGQLLPETLNGELVVMNSMLKLPFYSGSKLFFSPLCT